ncbi:MAG: DUF542 domain-containing protein [Proteobacteria bacterium]|nr:hypothetical protein [Desulfobulbaceae bacterium]MBU4152604.1 DUF542 domain-containing protein [Pseudomonadota bacterium]MDP2106300.1 DUF542 domain-containing protein [Desulfobulbaceae bacterium]
MNLSAQTIGEIVSSDFRTAKVFKSHDIDFCCGGNIPLAAVCSEKGIDLASITTDLAAAKSAPVERSQNYASWDLSFLIDYIINVHHAYLKENTGQIAAYLRKIAEVHGTHHLEVIEIVPIFDRISLDMTAHLKEEEDMFFPAVKRAEASVKAGGTANTQDIKM